MSASVVCSSSCAGIGLLALLESLLTQLSSSRVAQVDTSQPENQSPGLLNNYLLREKKISNLFVRYAYTIHSGRGLLCGTMARKRLQGNGVFGLGNYNVQTFFYIYSKIDVLTLVWSRITWLSPWSSGIELRDATREKAQ